MAHPCIKNEPCPITITLKLFKDTDFKGTELQKSEIQLPTAELYSGQQSIKQDKEARKINL